MFGKQILIGKTARRVAHAMVERAPEGSEVTVRGGNKRTLPQNDRLHAMCADLEAQVVWCGMRLTLEKWKRFATAQTFGQDMVPACGQDGQPAAGVVILAKKGTSEMDTEECGLVIEWLFWFGAQHQVQWSNESRIAAA